MGRFRNYVFAVSGFVILASAFAVIGPYVNQGQSAGVSRRHAGVLHQIAALSQQLDDVLDAVNNISTNGDLRGVTQNWDKKLDSTNGDANGCNSDRFTCVFPTATFPTGALVRDNETGLVWERSPDDGKRTWSDAIFNCSQKVIADRMGFHLPMIEQLASLVDRAIADPALPPMHPFQNIQSGDVFSDTYWTATTDTRVNVNLSQAWEVRITNGTTGDSNKVNSGIVWCVRGGQAFDGQDPLTAINSTPIFHN